MRARRASLVWIACALCGCDAPSATLDAGDLLGALDEASSAPSGSARVSAKAPKPQATASAAVRSPPREACAVVDAKGEPPEPRRIVGRPRCRDSQILESKDPEGAPRYACFYGARALEGRGPLPLVLFFHDQDGDAGDVQDRTSLRKHLTRAQVGSAKPGFYVLSVQGRALGKGGATFDARGFGPDNMDLWALDHFFEKVTAQGLIDQQRVFALGVGSGARMASFAGLARSSRVAAFAGYGAELPPVRWTCNDTAPPGLLLYRACDAVAPCDRVERSAEALGRGGVELERQRLGAGDASEPSCTATSKCSKAKGEAHHARFPKGREADILAFFAKHAVSAAAGASPP